MTDPGQSEAPARSLVGAFSFCEAMRLFAKRLGSAGRRSGRRSAGMTLDGLLEIFGLQAHLALQVLPVVGHHAPVDERRLR